MGKKVAERRLQDNEALAYGHNLRISPRKLGLVAGLIRGKTCEQALADLRFSKKRVAQDVRKILESAIANAENNHQLDVDKLYVAEVSVGRSLLMRRWQARARGRVGRIRKPFSNIRLIVRERAATAEARAEEKA
jgi:large subunit ribosomal protein L22